jgi:hypothetical protein
MMTPKKLNKKQEEVLKALVREYKKHQKIKKNIDVLFYEAGRLKIPAPQVAKKLGVSNFAVQQRYAKLPHKLL